MFLCTAITVRPIIVAPETNVLCNPGVYELNYQTLLIQKKKNHYNLNS